MSNWAPKPLRPTGTSSQWFSTVTPNASLHKSTAMEHQRAQDGTPMTRGGSSALHPTKPQPRLLIKGCTPASAADKEDPERIEDQLEKASEVVKSYLTMPRSGG